MNKKAKALKAALELRLNMFMNRKIPDMTQGGVVHGPCSNHFLEIRPEHNVEIIIPLDRPANGNV